jgi:L-alanine-DL-glutamate epimerase-like enolase superfamily enzyme
MSVNISINIRTEHWPYTRPFHITGHTFDGSDALVVTAQQGAHQGRGEAAGVYYRQESMAGMTAQIDAIAEAAKGASRQDLLSLLGPGGARNALDCAWWDLEAKQAGRPVWELAGLRRVRPLLTTYTIGVDDPAVMATRARAFVSARAIKLKLSGDGGDAERVRAVRQARPDVWLGVDANQGFTPDSYHALLPTLVTAKVALVEQPFAVGREADLDGLNSPILLAADESVQDRHGIEAMRGRVDVINIKLDKCGGLTEALAMVELIKAAGMKVMVGNMVGTSLSAAPGYVLGQLCDFVDLDGPMFLARDRQPAIYYEDGHIVCPEQVWGGAAN